MGVAERRERERKELREKIMDAARRLFVEHGYDAVSMRMIAREIEYSPTAIYLHFRDKESLFQELCDTDFLALAGRFSHGLRVADPRERLKAIGLMYVEFALELPNHFRLMFMTPSPPRELDEADRARRGNPEEDAYALLRQTVAEGIAAGRFRPEFTDPDQLAQLMWSGVHGVAALHVAKCQDEWVDWRDTRETARQMVEIMVRGVAREGAE